MKSGENVWGKYENFEDGRGKFSKNLGIISAYLPKFRVLPNLPCRIRVGIENVIDVRHRFGRYPWNSSGTLRDHPNREADLIDWHDLNIINFITEYSRDFQLSKKSAFEDN